MKLNFFAYLVLFLSAKIATVDSAYSSPVDNRNEQEAPQMFVRKRQLEEERSLAVIANWMTCNKLTDTCSGGWVCCVAPADVSTGKTTCRPGGSECSLVPNWKTCVTGETCAGGWTCCVAPADVSTGKKTCRPGGNECASTTTTVTNLAGAYDWTWVVGAPAVSGANMGVAFSGWADVTNALRDSAGTLSSLPGTKYLSIGGGNANGRFTAQVLSNLNAAITAGRLAGYQGICYDIEEGDAGLSTAFATSFATAKQYGFKVLVSVSHSAPYGITDAKTLMTSFFSNSNIDYITPQLYTTGTEIQNDYALVNGVTWNDWKSSRAPIVASIVRASYYDAARNYFSTNFGITLRGFIQWTN
jgi:hypothetical protein